MIEREGEVIYFRLSGLMATSSSGWICYTTFLVFPVEGVVKDKQAGWC
jgi:hypothetical protein